MPHVSSSIRAIEAHFLRNAIDVLIVGAGPAGLSAALNLGRARRSAAIFYSDEDRMPAHYNSHIDGNKRTTSVQTDMIAELKTNFKTVLFTNTAAKSVRESGMIFEVVDGAGRCWKGRKIVLATGIQETLPEIPGYRELRGTSIFDYFQPHRLRSSNVTSAATLITSDDKESIESAILSAHLARQYTPDITLLVNGFRHVDQHTHVIATVGRGFKVNSKAIKLFSRGDPESVTVEFEDGTKTFYGFIAHKPQSGIVGSFARELDLEMTPQGRIVAEGDFHETSIRGIFAAGSCASMIDDEGMEISSGMAAGMGASLQIAEDDAGL
ncbi:thioredoxin reductase [Fusarium sporotrichioides]|uniref:Thioredoxin reductase n=1 Tax=Fusarium sporotrichioides TaxID=5514 RepID=A0A395S5L6_FUSSP|nr:thioredoxin reductase [Fusarium sporotrichioides]